jgi:hypothetical protein
VASDTGPRDNTTAQIDRSRLLTKNSEDGELKKPPDPSSPCSRVQPGLEELQSHALETSGAMEEIDSFNKMESMDFPQLDNGPSGSASALDNKMDDEYYESESEADSVEERWVPTYEDLEVNVLRATGNNLDLAARLIPQLYEMFQQEESSVVDFLETFWRLVTGKVWRILMAKAQKHREEALALLAATQVKIQIIENGREKTTRIMVKKRTTARREIGTAIQKIPKATMLRAQIPALSHAHSTKGTRKSTMVLTDR